jgi:arylformamidase
MPVWPGDPAIEIVRVLDVACGDAATVTRLAIGSHTGTHVDAFSHFDATAPSLSDMDLAPYLGPCLVAHVESALAISDHDLLAATQPFTQEGKPIERLLLKTRNSDGLWYQQPFNPDFVHLAPSAAQWITRQGIQLVGMDYLSVEGYHVQHAPVHHHLIAQRTSILEGLYLGHVSPGWYDLICLPMALLGGDGAPARAVLKPL